jgi:hypothetical protein
MRSAIAAIISTILCGCPAPPPVPPGPPDADAAPAPQPTPAPTEPPAPPGPATRCSPACDAMTRVCGPQQPDCAVTLEHIDTAGVMRRPDGKPIKCADIAAATTKAAMQAAGVGCK